MSLYRWYDAADEPWATFEDAVARAKRLTQFAAQFGDVKEGPEHQGKYEYLRMWFPWTVGPPTFFRLFDVFDSTMHSWASFEGRPWRYDILRAHDKELHNEMLITEMEREGVVEQWLREG